MANDQLAKHAPQPSISIGRILLEHPLKTGGPLAAPRMAAAAGAQELKQWAWVPHASKATAAVYSADGKELFIATDDGSVSVWHPETYVLLRRYQLHLYSITALLFHAARGSLISASADGSVREWDPNEGTAKVTFKTLDKIPTALALSKDGEELAISDAGGNLYIQSVSSNSDIMQRQQAFNQSTASLAFHPAGEIVAAVGTDDKDNVGILRFWSKEGTLERELRGQGKAELTVVAFDPLGRWLAAGRQQGQVEIFNADSYEFKSVIAAHSQGITRLFFSNAGHLVSASADGSIAIHKKDSWENTRFFTAYRGSVADAVLSPDQNKIVECGSSVRVWNAARGYLLCTLEQFEGIVNAVCFSPDGKSLYSLSMDGIVKSWVNQPFFPQQEGRDRGYGACALACNPNGESLAAGRRLCRSISRSRRRTQASSAVGRPKARLK